MRKLTTIIFLCLNTLVYAQLGYNYEGKRIILKPRHENLYFVQTNNEKSKKLLRNMVKEENQSVKVSNRSSEISDNRFLVSSVLKLTDDSYVSDIYTSNTGGRMIVLPRILIAVDNPSVIKKILDICGGELYLDKVQRLNGIISLSCNAKTSKDVLELVNRIEIVNGVKWCEPDMSCDWMTYNTNPLFSQQYYLENNNNSQYDINVVPAWSLQTGNSTVTVAVLDEGIDANHEDLYGNVLQGYTVGDNMGYGAPKNTNNYSCKGHGVACAGIIGAKNNNIGIEGIAHGIKLFSVNIVPNLANNYYSGFADNSEIAYAIQIASQNADILSCSWGGNSYNSVIANALTDVMANGRNGKGCIVIAASGNNYPLMTEVSFPANISGVIAVGAIDKNGLIQSYSQRGKSMDLVAPSGACNLLGDIVTLDRMGNLGYNKGTTNSGDLSNTNYTKFFGGTSAACPQIAGVAALILSANPNLTLSQIRTILQSTTKKLPAMNGANWNTTYGYGLVDAYAAVQVAQNWVNCDDCLLSGPSNLCYPSSGHYSLNGVPLGTTVSWSFNKSYGDDPQLSSSGSSCNLFYRGGMFVGTLKAEVKIHGYTMATYTKQVCGDADVSGFYWDGEPYYDGYESTLTEDDNWATYPNIVLVRCNNLYGKTVQLYRSSAPYNYFSPMQLTNDYFMFEMPILNSGETLEVKISGGYNTQLFSFKNAATSYFNSNFLRVLPLKDNCFIFKRPSKTENNNHSSIWTLYIYKISDTKVLESHQAKDDNMVLDMNGHSAGIYIIRTIIDNTIYSAKISVK